MQGLLVSKNQENLLVIFWVILLKIHSKAKEQTRKCVNDVLQLKAARRDVTANLKCIEVRGHQQPNFDGIIYIPYAAPPYSARNSAIYLLYHLTKFGWVPFADLRVRSLTMK